MGLAGALAIAVFSLACKSQEGVIASERDPKAVVAPAPKAPSDKQAWLSPEPDYKSSLPGMVTAGPQLVSCCAALKKQAQVRPPSEAANYYEAAAYCEQMLEARVDASVLSLKQSLQGLPLPKPCK